MRRCPNTALGNYNALDIGLEIRVFTAQELRQCIVKIVTPTPLTHVVVPTVPAAAFFVGHLGLMGN